MRWVFLRHSVHVVYEVYSCADVSSVSVEEVQD